MVRSRLTILVPVLAILSAPPAGATVLVPADLTELSRGAAWIVRGTVSQVTPQWADGRRRIETVVTLEVAQVLKGDRCVRVSFKVPGGDIGRYRSIMLGAPTFRVGEEVILFLGATAPALPHLLGLGQGVYRIQRDTRTGEGRVISPALFASPDRDVTVRRGDLSRRTLSLEEFGGQVRASLVPPDSDRRRERPGAADRDRSAR